MMKNWEAYTRSDGTIAVDMEGKTITIKPGDYKNVEFCNYLVDTIRKDYPECLEAADEILQKQYGSQYANIKAVKDAYTTQLAFVILGCCFGSDETSHRDCNTTGELAPEQVACPLRGICPHNGFNPNTKKACCNPIFHGPLTQHQRVLADYLVHSPMSLAMIAEVIGCSLIRVRNAAKEIYAKMNVSSRSELTFVLQNKRLV